MRNLQTFMSLPTAIAVYFATGLVCNILPYLMDFLSYFSSLRGVGQDFFAVEFVYNWIFLFLIYSIFPVFTANFVMNLMLKREERFYMSLLPKVIFAILGVGFYSFAIVASIALGMATKVTLASYTLSILSFMVTPLVLSTQPD